MPLADTLRHRIFRAARLGPLGLALTLAACTTGPAPTPTGTPAPAPTASAAAASPTATAVPAPTAAPSPAPVTLCTVAHLSAAIEPGSANNASGGLVGFVVTIRNVGAVACTLRQLDEVKLVDKNGVVMIASGAPGVSALLFLNVGAVLKTTIQARNYCGPTPVQPATVEFVLPGGVGTVRAKPLATNPGAIVPSCFQNGIAASLSMSAWGP